MAKLHGKSGVVYEGSSAVGEVTDWNYNGTADIASGKSKGQDDEELAAGHKSGSGSISGFRDPDDTGQNALVEGATISLKLYHEATGTSYAPAAGDNMLSGDVIIESVQEGSPAEGFAPFTINFRGVLARGTHPSS